MTVKKYLLKFNGIFMAYIRDDTSIKYLVTFFKNSFFINSVFKIKHKKNSFNFNKIIKIFLKIGVSYIISFILIYYLRNLIAILSVLLLIFLDLTYIIENIFWMNFYIFSSYIVVHRICMYIIKKIFNKTYNHLKNTKLFRYIKLNYLPYKKDNNISIIYSVNLDNLRKKKDPYIKKKINHFFKLQDEYYILSRSLKEVPSKERRKIAEKMFKITGKIEIMYEYLEKK